MAVGTCPQQTDGLSQQQEDTTSPHSTTASLWRETSGLNKDHKFCYALRSSGPVKPLPWIWMKMTGLELPTLPAKQDQMVLGKWKA